MGLIGIPKLPRLTDFKGTINNILSDAQARLWGQISGTTWCIYKAGTTTVAVEVDSILELSIQGESSVADYPIENNSFDSYNKVAMPFEVSLRICRGGSITARDEFVSWLVENEKNATLFDIQTPEKLYQNVTLVRKDISRKAQTGEDVVMADCSFREIREVPSEYWNSKTSQITAPRDSDAASSTPLQKVSSITSSIKTNAQNVFKTINRIKSGDISGAVDVIDKQFGTTIGSTVSDAVSNAEEIARNTAKNLIDYAQGVIGKSGNTGSTTVTGKTRVGVDTSSAK